MLSAGVTDTPQPPDLGRTGAALLGCVGPRDSGTPCAAHLGRDRLGKLGAKPPATTPPPAPDPRTSMNWSSQLTPDLASRATLSWRSPESDGPLQTHAEWSGNVGAPRSHTSSLRGPLFCLMGQESLSFPPRTQWSLRMDPAHTGFPGLEPGDFRDTRSQSRPEGTQLSPAPPLSFL